MQVFAHEAERRKDKKSPLFLHAISGISPYSHSLKKDLQTNQDELRPLILCYTKDWGLSFTALTAFCRQGHSNPIVHLLDQHETNHIPHRLHLSWHNTSPWSGEGGDFCSQNSWTVLKHRKPCRDLFREKVAEAVKVPPFTTMHLLGRGRLLRATGDLTPCIYVTKCHIS